MANSASARLQSLKIWQTSASASGIAELVASPRHAFREIRYWPHDRARDGRARPRTAPKLELALGAGFHKAIDAHAKLRCLVVARTWPAGIGVKNFSPW